MGLDAADCLDFVAEASNFYTYVRKDEINDEAKSCWAEQGRKRARRAKRLVPGGPGSGHHMAAPKRTQR
jgi:hypothetical protein